MLLEFYCKAPVCVINSVYPCNRSSGCLSVGVGAPVRWCGQSCKGLVLPAVGVAKIVEVHSLCTVDVACG